MEKSTDKISRDYNHYDLPPVKNIFVYNYRCLVKILHLIFFGLGGLVIGSLAFPFIRLFTPNKEKFQIRARAFVSLVFRQFLNSIKFFGLARFEKFDLKKYENLHSKIIVANHPSLLDFVFIMAMVPNSNCIVRGGLLKTPVGLIVKNAYIVNSLDFEELCARCNASLKAGCNVIIFQEGTRTPRHGRNPYKKGAARIAYYANCNLLPVFIGGSDKYGLGKNDPVWSFNKIESYLYTFEFLDEVKVEDYKDEIETLAAKHMTDECERRILAAGKLYEANHPDCETLNNI